MEGATAVPGGTSAATGGIKGAAVAAPEAAGPEGRQPDRGGLVWQEGEAATGKQGPASAGLNARPNGVRAAVEEGYGCR